MPVLKSCKGNSCVKHCSSLYPHEDVLNLKQATISIYDEFYKREEVRVKYTKCERGHVIESEGPQVLTCSLIYRDGAAWNAWTLTP
jgi:N-acetylglucosamine-6-sulfatase